MASTNETGHAKNVANFDELIGFCTGYGVTYNPSKASIKLAALSSLLTGAQTALASTKTAKQRSTTLLMHAKPLFLL